MCHERLYLICDINSNSDYLWLICLKFVEILDSAIDMRVMRHRYMMMQDLPIRIRQRRSLKHQAMTSLYNDAGSAYINKAEKVIEASSDGCVCLFKSKCQNIEIQMSKYKICIQKEFNVNSKSVKFDSQSRFYSVSSNSTVSKCEFQ